MHHPDFFSEMQDFFFPDVERVVKDGFQLQPSFGMVLVEEHCLAQNHASFQGRLHPMTNQ